MKIQISIFYKKIQKGVEWWSTLCPNKSKHAKIVTF